MFIKILKSNGKLKGRMTLGETKIQIAEVSRLPNRKKKALIQITKIHHGGKLLLE